MKGGQKQRSRRRGRGAVLRGIEKGALRITKRRKAIFRNRVSEHCYRLLSPLG